MQSILNRGHRTLDIGRKGLQLTRIYTMLIGNGVGASLPRDIVHIQWLPFSFPVKRESKYRPCGSVYPVVRTWFCIGYRTNEDLLLLKHQLSPPFRAGG